MTTKAQTTTLAGHAVTIRPIRSSDVAMEAVFVKMLSPETKHYRFFGGVKELSTEQMKRLCVTDGVHSMAFVATVEQDGVEVEIGVCRYVPDSSVDVREIAVTIADEWLHKGVGELLMQRLIATARHHGVRRLYSLELADNTMMRELATVLGMSASNDPHDAQQVIYSLAI